MTHTTHQSPPEPSTSAHSSAVSVRLWGLVPCAGTGSRSGATGPKQYALLGGKAMVLHTLQALTAVDRLAGIQVVVSSGDGFFNTVPHLGGAPVLVADCGGSTRAGSVLNGLEALLTGGARPTDWVLVHDAARCLIRPEDVDRLIDACLADSVGGLLALKLPDTLKQECDGRVSVTVDRADKWLAQTPQMFRIGALQAALQAAGDAVTDEASALEFVRQKPLLVDGSAQNFKVTYPQDFALAEAILSARSSDTHSFNTESNMNFRIGEGWDTHQLVEGRKLILGGVEIPHSKGLLGHSDADALLHAITDALLGAAALGDIGKHFPDTDVQYKGADSSLLLSKVAADIRALGYSIVNLDTTVIAQEPKLAPHIQAMRGRIAEVLEIELGSVNVKAKTAEKMGPVGEGRAIEARAVVLLR